MRSCLVQLISSPDGVTNEMKNTKNSPVSFSALIFSVDHPEILPLPFRGLNVMTWVYLRKVLMHLRKLVLYRMLLFLFFLGPLTLAFVPTL